MTMEEPSIGVIDAHTVDLDAYTGRTIKLRFFFDSIDNVSNNYAGWFFDNVETTAS
jgi:hypothetical protein